MIIVAGRLEVDPADRASFVERSAEAVRLARAAPGCLDFAVSADTVEAGRVNIFERWATEEQLQAFRGMGPDDDQQATIRAYHVDEYRLDPADS